MSMDTLAKRMGQATREDVEETVDIEARLGELYGVRRRRRTVKAAAGLAAVSVLGAVTVGALSSGGDDVVQPAGPVSSTRCPDSDLVECLDGSTIRVLAKVPYTFDVTSGFSEDFDVSGVPYTIDVFASGAEHGGVTIMSGATPADAPRVDGAQGLARWVADRAFLTTSPVTRTTLDGFDTWSVEVRLAPPGSGAAGVCNVVQNSCRPVLEQANRSHWQTGVWDGMVSRYRFLDVPGLGTVAVSSWIFPAKNTPWTYEESVLDRYETLVNSIDFQVS